MIRPRQLVLVGLLALAATGCTEAVARIPAAPAETSPRRLSDSEFWRLVSGFSEAGGVFPSDNFVSNETWFQHVIPRLTQHTGRGGAYLGVGPDQNFTYIVALRPQMAFILDIRRQNLMLHLLYKALIEQSPDRAAFLSNLFSRPRPPGLGRQSGAAALVRAYAVVPPSDTLFQNQLRWVAARLTQHHHFTLTSDDLASLAAVYTAFFRGGPDIQYSIRTNPSLQFPTYAELIQQTDADGEPHGYLSSEEHFRALKDLEAQNLIVPIVGNFAGDKALPAVGQYLKAHGMRVTAFYVSNVEQYLFQEPAGWRQFYAHLAALPVDERTTLIRSYNLRVTATSGAMRIQLATVLDSLEACVRAVGEGRVTRYVDVIERSPLGEP
jgi:hypothetical protein